MAITTALFLLFFISIASTDAAYEFCWKDYTPGILPRDALKAADGRYIGQVNYQGSLPATIYPHSKIAIAEFSGRVLVSSNIKIFCTSRPERFYWQHVNFQEAHAQQMKNAVRGGYQNNIASDLFIGKAYHEGEWKVGKVVSIEHDLKGLFVWNKQGYTVRLYEFSLLKYRP